MNTVGIVLLIIGVILMVFGAIFTFVTLGFGILCSWPLILVGFILVIIGAVLPGESKPTTQQPIIIQQPAPQ
jgi:uncharacterized membrane protein